MEEQSLEIEKSLDTSSFDYERPKITIMGSDDVLRAFQMTAAQISSAGCWWFSC